jgi:hypothetical protein
VGEAVDGAPRQRRLHLEELPGRLVLGAVVGECHRPGRWRDHGIVHQRVVGLAHDVSLELEFLQAVEIPLAGLEHAALQVPDRPSAPVGSASVRQLYQRMLGSLTMSRQGLPSRSPVEGG